MTLNAPVHPGDVLTGAAPAAAGTTVAGAGTATPAVAGTFAEVTVEAIGNRTRSFFLFFYAVHAHPGRDGT